VAKRVPSEGSRDLESAIDELYQQPLASFTSGRNALATELRKAGRTEDSNRVKALGKPSVSTWALNQVYWHERDVFDRMLRAGDQSRHVQQQLFRGKAGDPREAMATRQAAVRTLVEHAIETLQSGGQVVTDTTRQRIMVTAEAMATYGSDSPVFRPGRLVDDLDPPGFAALATLGGGGAPLRLVKGEQPTAEAPLETRATGKHPASSRKPEADPRLAAREREADRRRRREEAQQTLREAERALRDAERDRARSHQQADHARHALESLTDLQKDLQEQLARLAPKVQAAQEAAGAAERSVNSAEGATQQAREQADRARAELDDI
jgi:hypothetical protein